MTDPAMEARRPITARPSRLRPLTLARLPISWTSDASPFSATLAAGPVPSPAELCSGIACLRSSASPVQRHGPLKDSTISPGCQTAVRANFGLLLKDEPNSQRC
jgi:hypothetical protein